ncbi:MAG: SUMF1/EgtB/PvdO family nonheme iron enzyme [Bryobacteraceae bacterium]
MPAGNGVQRYDRVAATRYPSYWWQRLDELFKLFSTTPAPPFRRSVAFLTGVGKYRYLGELKGVESDINQLRDLLLTDGGFDTVYMLREQDVKRSTIDRFMRNEFALNGRLLGVEDRLLFYYSGHGSDQQESVGYLQFSEAQPGDFASDYVLPIGAVEEWARLNVARHFLAVLDACASGLAVKSQDGSGFDGLSGEGSGYLLTAGTADQKVYQVELNAREQHSVLTHGLIDAIRSGAADSRPYLPIHWLYGQAQNYVGKFNSANPQKRMDPQLTPLMRRKGFLKGTFVFLNGKARDVQVPNVDLGHVSAKSGTAGPISESVLLAAYRLVENSTHLPTLQSFVDQYRDVPGAGPFVESIKVRIEELRKPVVVPPKPSALTAGTKRVNEKDGLGYVWIPPGKFTMGCSPGDQQCEDDEKPAHEVEIILGFWMGETEVTQEAYQKVIGANPSTFKGTKRPVEHVSWDEASKYCKTVGLRLPTEAEWEYAARAGSKEARYGPLDRVAWSSETPTAEVARGRKKAPNAWGLYDTLGSVWEWVADWYDPNYHQLAVFARLDPSRRGTEERRGLRGGSRGSAPRNVRVSDRDGIVPSVRLNDIGFRCAGELR